MKSPRLGTLLFAVVVASCAPVHPPPEGYVDSCYGGNARNLKDGVLPKLFIKVVAPEERWPELAAVVTEFGQAHGFDVFNGSKNLPHVRMVSVSICDPNGLMILTDERIFRDMAREPDGDVVQTILYQYSPQFDWRPVAESLISHFRQRWPTEIEITWGPEVDGGV